MLKDILSIFTNELCQYLIGESIAIKGLLIKKHSVNLQTQGDFSFPNILKSWQGHLKEKVFSLSNTDNTLLKYVGKDCDNIVQDSEKWMLPVKKAIEEKDRIHLFIDRYKAIKIGLLYAMQNNELLSQTLAKSSCEVKIDPLCAHSNCITYLRLKYLCEVVKNLVAIYSISLTEDIPNFVVSSKSSSNDKEERLILCGTVLNVSTGVKETTLLAEDFIRLRQNELTLIAQHKYGVRVSTDSKWKEFIAHLGESAVAFELLQTKPSCAVKINSDASSGSSKGAAFILYNCARLETIIRTYNERVSEGTYPPLPEFEDTDFSLLTQEEEWCLIFNYILGFPSLLKNCVEINEQTCDFRTHFICGFLCSMVRLFSQYYRKIRILTEPRKHLLPVMFARLHMLKILNDTLKTCLKILNIKSVSQM